MNHLLKIGFTIFLISISLLTYSQQTYFNKYWDYGGAELKSNSFFYNNHYFVSGSRKDLGVQRLTIEKLDTNGISLKYREIIDTSTIIYASLGNSLVRSNTGSIYHLGSIGKDTNIAYYSRPYFYKTNTNLDSISFLILFEDSLGTKLQIESAVFRKNYIYALGTDTIPGKSHQTSLLKIDTNGNVVWQKKYLSPGTGMVGTTFGAHIDTTSDNGFVLLSSHNKNILIGGPDDIRVLKVDSLGNEEWSRIIYRDIVSGNNSHSSPFFIKSTTDGFIYVGAGIPETQNNEILNVIKLDYQNNQIWRKKYGYIAELYDADFIERGDGYYDIFFSGDYTNTSLVRINSNGDVLRKSDFGSVNNSSTATFLHQATGFTYIHMNNSYTVFGALKPIFNFTNSPDNLIIKLDSNGCNLNGTPYNLTVVPIQVNGQQALQVNWVDTILSNNRKYSVEVRFKEPNNENYYYKVNNGLVSGYSYIDTNITLYPYPIHSYRVRAVDSITNNVSCASEMAYILNVEENNQLKEIEAKFYPNPAKEFFYVEILNPEKEQITLSIHNLLGEKIKTQQFSANYLKEQINTKQLSKGIYIVSIQNSSGNLLKQSKIVVQ